MTATTVSATTITAPAARPTTQQRHGRRLWKTGVVAGLAASVATLAFAAVVDAAGVSLEVGGEAIPLIGFAQVTFVASLIGTALADAFARWARHAHRMFLRTTIALTVISFVPDVLADAQTGTKLALALSHVVAAAIVIPALASRLSD
jgi:hypothetical protein